MTDKLSRPGRPAPPLLGPSGQPTRRRVLRRPAATVVAAAALVLAGFGPLALAAANLSPGSASTGAAAWGTSTPSDNPAPAQEPSPWWMAFNDATLNLLVRAAQQRQAGLASLQAESSASGSAADLGSEDARRQVVASYLGARVMSARWLALNGVRNAAERQRELLAVANPGQPAPAADIKDMAANLQQRSDRVAQQQQALAAERENLLQRLGELCGMSSAELADLLAPALNQASIPAFGSAVPARLPRSILRARPDVATAEAAVLRSLRTAGNRQHEVVAQMQQADGWIAAEGDPNAARHDPAAPRKVLTAAAAAAPELADLRALMDAATQEVAENLYSLGERARLQSERAQLAEASRAAFFAARDQLKTGEVTELQVLEQYQRLLAESDRYVSACGELAMAWLRLVASTGASDQVMVRQGL